MPFRRDVVLLLNLLQPARDPFPSTRSPDGWLGSSSQARGIFEPHGLYSKGVQAKAFEVSINLLRSSMHGVQVLTGLLLTVVFQMLQAE